MEFTAFTSVLILSQMPESDSRRDEEKDLKRITINSKATFKLITASRTFQMDRGNAATLSPDLCLLRQAPEWEW